MQLVECKHVNGLMYKSLGHEKLEKLLSQRKKENMANIIKKVLSQKQKAMYQNDRRFK